MPFFGKCPNDLGKLLKLFNLDRRFTGLGFKEFPFKPDDIP
jgi:hypothetical protein